MLELGSDTQNAAHAPARAKVHVATGSRLSQARMVAAAERAAPRLRQVPELAWWRIFTGAAARLEDPEGDTAAVAARVSDATGLPQARVRRALWTLARDCRQLPEILARQSPDGSTAPYRTGTSGATGSGHRAAATSPSVCLTTSPLLTASGCRCWARAARCC
jgi:hypothetical protein